ncbi:MAG: COQ9 family protein [Microgenomates group bacterium]
MDHENTMEDAKNRLLDAALPHVAFDGWSDTTLRAALNDSGLATGLAPALFPRGGIDLAVAYHKRGDRQMSEDYLTHPKTDLGIRQRVTLAVKLRLQRADKELVRRGSVLFGMPHHAIEGAGLIWGTADAVWNALGDTSRDVNWYTKRTTLSAVYASTVLYWLGDTSADDQDSWAFLDRRIENVMQFEKAKARAKTNPLTKAMMDGPLKILERITAPQGVQDLPGRNSH